MYLSVLHAGSAGCGLLYSIFVSILIKTTIFHTHLVHFKSKKLKIKGFNNIYQKLMKKEEKKEDTVVFL